MSRVFVATETRLRRKVVVKVLAPDLAQGISVERFEREIQLAASLQQANIVPVLTAGDTDGLPYYIMPYVEGESLRHRLDRGPLSVTEVVGVLRDVSRALVYAHSHSIVHRDIKPDNVLLSAGTAVVTDFGIAKALSAARTGHEGVTLTRLGTSIGTPAYMAPEQAAGDPDIDARVDLYALGCMAYELLCGAPPFAGRTAQRVLAAHMSETPPPIRELRRDTPPALADLVMRCLQKDPGDRPPSAADLTRALDAITNGQLAAEPALLAGGNAAFRRALLWYLGSFIAVAVLARTAIVGIGLPSWVLPGALMVMALGLPVLLFTAYSQRVARTMAAAAPVGTHGGTVVPPAPHGTMATLAIKAGPHLSWRRVRDGGLIALGGFVVLVGTFMMLRALGIGPAGSLLASGKLKRQAQVLVPDFVIRNADTSLATVLSGAARTGLAQSSVISVVPPNTIASTLRLMRMPVTDHLDPAAARDVAARLGAPVIVAGEATGVGSGFIVTLRLITADSGKELASFQATGDGPQGLIDAVGKSTRELRGRIGESLREVQRTPPLSRVTTSSLQALRAYTRAEWANDAKGDFSAAIRYAREAVADDSMFAEAWRKLGVVLRNFGAPRTESDDAIRHAYALRARLPENERLLIEATYFAPATGGPGHDRDRAIMIYREMLARGDSLMGNNLGLELRSRRDYPAAESAFAAAAKAYPHIVSPRRSLLLVLHAEGRELAADSVARLLQAGFPGPGTDAQVAYLLYSRGQFDSVATLAARLQATNDPISRDIALGFSAGIALIRGRLAEWRRLRALQRTLEASSGAARGAVTDSVIDVLVDIWPVRKPQAAVAGLDAALAEAPPARMPEADRPYLAVAPVYAMAGRPDLARRMVEQYRLEVRDSALVRFREPMLHTVLGEIALAEHKADVAIREFRAGDQASDGPANPCGACLPLELARAFDAAGQSDSAIAMFETFLATPTSSYDFSFWLPVELNVPAAHLRLGELYEARGDRQNALKHYQSFLDLYRNADPELQPMVTDVKRRMTNLTAG